MYDRMESVRYVSRNPRRHCWEAVLERPASGHIPHLSPLKAICL